MNGENGEKMRLWGKSSWKKREKGVVNFNVLHLFIECITGTTVWLVDFGINVESLNIING